MKKAVNHALIESMLEEVEADIAPSKDTLAEIHGKVAELREFELTKAGLEEELKEVNIRIRDILWGELPKLMDEARVPGVTIAEEGNKPAYSVKIADEYKAVLPEENREAGLDVIKKYGGGDLIKAQFVVSFGMGDNKAIKKFESMLEKAGIVNYESKLSVPWNSLTAWFREEYRKKPWSMTAMEAIGATVGRVAKVVKQREKK
jgi:hypothetical protein